MKIKYAECKHYNAEWITVWGGHFWRCKSCRSAVQPISPTKRQQVAVFYAPAWDKLAPQWDWFRKTELGLDY